jgi:nitroreductase
MELIEAVRQRTSTRAFSARTVAKEDIARIIESGVCAPTKGNCQIWEFVVVTGVKKQALDKELLHLVRTDLIPSMQVGDVDGKEKSEAVKRAERRSGQNKKEISGILSPLGMDFTTFMLEGTFTFFSAPVAILVWVDQAFSKDLPHILGVGAAVQNMLLAATNIGLGTCWIGGVWRYEKTITSILGLPAGRKLLSSIALGYPDEDSPICRYKASRDSVSEFISWIGFDENR